MARRNPKQWGVDSDSPAAEFLYQPQGPTMAKFHQDRDHHKHFVRSTIGPLGSGKTQGHIAEVLDLVDSQKLNRDNVRRSRWAVVRNTAVDLQNTTIKDWRELVDPLQLGRFVGGANAHQQIRYQRPGDGTIVQSEIMFLAYEHLDTRKIRGLQLTGIWFNEMKELSIDVVMLLLSRLGRFPSRASLGDYWQGAIGDCNAPPADDWMGKMALKTKPRNWTFYIQPGGVIKRDGKWITNPNAENLQNLPENYYDRQIEGHSEDWIRANLANEFVLVIDGRPVHPDFNQRTHVSDFELEPIPGIPLAVGIDFGRTPAASILQQDHEGRWRVLDELVSINTGAQAFGGILKSFLNDRYETYDIEFTGDPSGNDQAQTRDETPIEMLAESGIFCFPAPTNDFEQRTTALDRLLRSMPGGEPAILISPRCEVMIRGLTGAYQFRKVQVSGQDRYHELPFKDATSHVVESVHYALLGAGEGETALWGHEWQKEYDEIEEEHGGRWRPDQSKFE